MIARTHPLPPPLRVGASERVLESHAFRLLGAHLRLARARFSGLLAVGGRLRARLGFLGGLERRVGGVVGLHPFAAGDRLLLGR